MPNNVLYFKYTVNGQPIGTIQVVVVEGPVEKADPYTAVRYPDGSYSIRFPNGEVFIQQGRGVWLDKTGGSMSLHRLELIDEDSNDGC